MYLVENSDRLVHLNNSYMQLNNNHEHRQASVYIICVEFVSMSNASTLNPLQYVKRF